MVYVYLVMARSEYFKVMCTRIGEYGAHYVPPTNEALRTTLLDREKLLVEQATSNMKRQWSKYGVSLVADGWSDTRRRSIHGMVAYCKGEMYFAHSQDATATGKGADVLAAEWAATIETIGSKLVIGFVTDGEASNRAAAVILESMYPHLTVSFCMAHCLNNLLKDIGHLSWIEPHMADAAKVVTFINNHNLLRAQFLQRSGGKVLLKYCETRFAYNYLMVHRLCELQSAVRQLFICTEYTSSSYAGTTTGKFCAAKTESLLFWDELKKIDKMVKPIVHLLRVVDGMQPCIGKVYEAMDRMVEALDELEPDEDRREEIRGLCHSRWDSYASPLHGAAFMVDPEFQGCGQEEDAEVNKQWNIILNRMHPDHNERRKIRDQLAKYRDMTGSFGLADAQADRKKISAVLWWQDYGSDGPDLQRLAVRILSQAVSSSCLEQLWSVYSHIASKKRNRLEVDKASDLVFVSANLRMLCKSAEKVSDPFTKWEMEAEAEFLQEAGESGRTAEDDDEQQHEEEDWDAIHDIQASTTHWEAGGPSTVA